MRYLFHFILFFFAFSNLAAQDLPAIEAKTSQMTKLDGFYPLYWDAKEGKLWLEVNKWNQDFLYNESLPAGLGSNDIGLDRGQLGAQRIVHFERVGAKVLMVMPNLDYRANQTTNPAERRAIKDSFAESILWGFTVAAQTDQRVLVDATSFVVRDAHNIVQTLKNTGQGSFSFDASRSVVNLDFTKAFPKNSEMEARVTFTSDNAGQYVRESAADASSITLRVRHSFIELPDDGYKPRVSDPRSGYFGFSYNDYSVPIGTDKTRRFITRHRLQKNASGEVIKPIVYYLDAGTPEPVRSALLEGARWWSEAFDKAGFKNGFRVEMLPPDADPMDVRYNVIQWVHRATRGWSYGSAVTDPRTGEIIKGHVSLGSLRVRQDYLIAEGLLAPYRGDNENGIDPSKDPMLAMSLARLRQLSAHEVGHTLGLNHNFAASVSNRASVMDYPAMLPDVKNGKIDLSDAYDTGVGAWDTIAIQYGYSEIPANQLDPDGGETKALDAILDLEKRQNLQYITDEDARPQGGAHPSAHLWDNLEDPLSGLKREMRVREVALKNLDERVIRNGQPMAQIEEVLVPVYLRHRYQAEAVSKLVGGVQYAYSLRGKDFASQKVQAVNERTQREALNALLNTLDPEALRLPEKLLSLIPPRPPTYGRTRELFDGHTGLTFDPYSPAETASEMVIGLLLNPDRCARLAYQKDIDNSLPDLDEVLKSITTSLFASPANASSHASNMTIRRIERAVFMDALMDLASNTRSTPIVRAKAVAALNQIKALAPSDDFGSWIRDEISRFLTRPYQATEQLRDVTTPPGQPIGSTEDFHQRRQRRQQMLASVSAECDIEE